jgi:hypothetical protein
MFVSSDKMEPEMADTKNVWIICGSHIVSLRAFT